jgi:hypothetical protein
MALAVVPSALPAPKKNSHYQVFLTTTGGTLPISWAVTSGALPGFLTLRRTSDNQAVVEGHVPATLNAGTFTATITATDSAGTPLTATCVSTSIALGVDGPDSQGYHGTEANRTTVVTIDQFRAGQLTPADLIARMWPLTGPSQNS